MALSEATAERLFFALKKLSDLAQESHLVFHETEKDDDVRKKYRQLVGDILGSAYDPILRSLMNRFTGLSMAKLRERIPLQSDMSARSLMEAVLMQGDAVMAEFRVDILEGEIDGLFREGAASTLTAEIDRLRQFAETRAK
jgi:hypothetical protein